MCMPSAWHMTKLIYLSRLVLTDSLIRWENDVSLVGSGSDVQSSGTPEAAHWGVGLGPNLAAPSGRWEREWSARSSSLCDQGATASLGKEPALQIAAADQVGNPAGLGFGSAAWWRESGWGNAWARMCCLYLTIECNFPFHSIPCLSKLSHIWLCWPFTLY